MKPRMLVFVFFLFSSISPAMADVYMKIKAMGGMGETEQWTGGSKRRTATQAPVMGEMIQISRPDKGVEWEIGTDFKAYSEKQIPLPYAAEKEQGGEEMTEEGLSVAAENKSSDTDEVTCTTKKVAEQRTYAGFRAEGYASFCGGVKGSTIWVSAPGQPEADRIQKEMDAFDKANLESLYSRYPPKEREQAIKAMTLLGTALAQGLMGMPDGTKMPAKRVTLALENAQAEDDGSPGNMMLEVVEAKIVQSNSSLYEVPADYTKVDNIDQLRGEKMMGSMGDGSVKLSDLMAGMAEMTENVGGPVSPEEIRNTPGMAQADEFGQGTAQFIQQQQQLQGGFQQMAGSGRVGAGAVSEATLSHADGTDLPLEPWQQNLYSGQPQNIPQAPQQNYQNAPKRRPSGQAARQRRAQQAGNTRETLEQVQGLLTQVQGIASSLNGGGVTDFSGSIPEEGGEDYYEEADYGGEEYDAEDMTEEPEENYE